MNAEDTEKLLTEIYTWPELNASKSRDFGRGYAQAIRDVETYLRDNARIKPSKFSR